MSACTQKFVARIELLFVSIRPAYVSIRHLTKKKGNFVARVKLLLRVLGITLETPTHKHQTHGSLKCLVLIFKYLKIPNSKLSGPRFERAAACPPRGKKRKKSGTPTLRFVRRSTHHTHTPHTHTHTTHTHTYVHASVLIWV
jgi:hypothetical protein